MNANEEFGKWNLSNEAHAASWQGTNEAMKIAYLAGRRSADAELAVVAKKMRDKLDELGDVFERMYGEIDELIEAYDAALEPTAPKEGTHDDSHDANPNTGQGTVAAPE